MIIRVAKRKDASALIELIAGLDRHPAHNAPGIWSHGSPRARLGSMMRDSAVRVLVAEEDGRLLAYVAGKFEIRPQGPPRRVGQIMQAFVKPGLRRRGVGTALVADLLAWFDKRRVESVTLSYVLANREGRSFWTRLGFRPLIVRANATPATIRRRAARLRSRSASPR